MTATYIFLVFFNTLIFLRVSLNIVWFSWGGRTPSFNFYESSYVTGSSSTSSSRTIAVLTLARRTHDSAPEPQFSASAWSYAPFLTLARHHSQTWLGSGVCKYSDGYESQLAGGPSLTNRVFSSPNHFWFSWYVLSDWYLAAYVVGEAGKVDFVCS